MLILVKDKSAAGRDSVDRSSASSKQNRKVFQASVCGVHVLLLGLTSLPNCDIFPAILRLE
jgi:hypothetical protein